MTRNYEIADIGITFNTDFSFGESGFAPLFRKDGTGDFIVDIRLGDIGEYSSPIYSADRRTIYRDENNKFFTVFYDEDYKRNHFILRELEDKFDCVLHRECQDVGKDIQHFLGFVNLPEILMRHRRLLIHASFIIVHGKAILFSGRSGIGKSTQSRLWENQENAVTVNGDKAVLYMKDGILTASSIPIAGTSKICLNREAPVAGIVFLSQGKSNICTPLSPSETIAMLINNSVGEFAQRGELLRIADVASEFCDKTKFISYECVPDETAVRELGKALF